RERRQVEGYGHQRVGVNRLQGRGAAGNGRNRQLRIGNPHANQLYGRLGFLFIEARTEVETVGLLGVRLAIDEEDIVFLVLLKDIYIWETVLALSFSCRIDVVLAMVKRQR